MAANNRSAASLRPLLPLALFALLPAGAGAAEADTSAAASVSSAAAPKAAGKEGWDDMMESLLAKEGITMSGIFRSQYLHSSIGGEGAVSSKRSEESLEYTSVDFDIRARPNTATQGRLVFRMHQDWRNFFSDVGNPISSRWISIDGRVKEVFRYNIGDFRQKYSPLTLHSPDISLLYEPEIFAAQRRDAMGEHFLGGNDRMLQGVNFNLDAGLQGASGGTLLKEFHANAMGARLRNVETSVQNGSKPVAFVERTFAEKFLGAANLQAALPAGISLGGTAMHIFDKKGSFDAQGGDPDTAAQSTSIFAGRGGFDLGSALGWNRAAFAVSGEFATSLDDTSFFADDSGNVLRSNSLDGSALLAGVSAGWRQESAFGIKVKVDYHRNEPLYRNELAQSPSFVGERIMNIENDTTPAVRRTNDVRAMGYSTFDAMNRHAFKFAPSEQTNLWVKAPFSKNSYTNSIMTQTEMAQFAAWRLDPALQLVMPFGPATPNRAGLSADISLSAWEDRIEVRGVAAMLDQIEGDKVDSVRSMPKTAFTQAGGGLLLKVGSMFALAYPLDLSVSLVRSTAANDGLADTLFAASEMRSDFMNASFRYQFWKRAAVLAGWQQIKNRHESRGDAAERTQDNVAGGLEYKVADGAFVTSSLSRITMDPGASATEKKFSQLQTDLYLTVRF